MKKTALASAITLAMMSSSVWAVPCNVLGPTGKPISPFDKETGVSCTTTTVAGQFILDKSTVRAGETVNLAVLGLNAAGEVDRFGEDGGSILMAVVSTAQGLITKTQGSDNSGQRPEDLINEGTFINRQGNPAINPDSVNTLRVIKLENGNGEINIYYPASSNTTIGGRVTVKLQERESTANGGIRVNTIAEVTKQITLLPPIGNPGSLDISSFTANSSDDAGVSDLDSSTGIAGTITAGNAGSGAEITVKASDVRAAGTVNLSLTAKGKSEPAMTLSGFMANGEAVISLDSFEKTGSYYIKAEMSYEEGGETKTVSSVALDYADMFTVVSTGVPYALSLKSNKERIERVGQGATLTVSLLDQYGNATSDRAGNTYEVSLTEADGEIADNWKLTVPATGKITTVLGDEAADIDALQALPELSLTASAIGIQPSSVLTLKVVDKVFTITQLPTFAAGGILNAGVQTDAILVEENPNTATGSNPITITKSGEVSEALRDPTTKVVRAAFKSTGSGPYMVSDRNGEYAQTIIYGPDIIPSTPTDMRIVNAHGEVVNAVKTTVTTNKSGLVTVIPEKAVHLIDAYSNAVTGNAAGRFTVTSPLGATVTYANGSSGIPASESPTDVVTLTHLITTAGTGDVALTVDSTAPGFSDKTSITTVLPAISTLDAIKAYVEQTTIPVNSKVALSVELMDQNGDQISSDQTNSIRLVVNSTEGDTITSPSIREVNADGSRGALLTADKVLTFSNGKKVFEVNAGQTTGQFTLSFVDPTGAVEEAATTVFTVTQVLENECTSTNPAGCMDEVTCNAVGGGYSGDACSSLPALGVVGMDNTGGEVVATGASVKGGFSVNGNAFANPATATDTGASIKIVASLEPADADVGAEADTIVMFTSYFLDGALDLTRIFVLGDGGASVTPWDFTIEGIPAYTTQTLAEYNVLNLLDTGDTGFGIEGNLLILVAYRLTNGTVVYSENLLSLQIDDPRI